MHISGKVFCAIWAIVWLFGSSKIATWGEFVSGFKPFAELFAVTDLQFDEPVKVLLDPQSNVVSGGGYLLCDCDVVVERFYAVPERTIIQVACSGVWVCVEDCEHAQMNA
jgi:hypothetical protein